MANRPTYVYGQTFAKRSRGNLFCFYFGYNINNPNAMRTVYPRTNFFVFEIGVDVPTVYRCHGISTETCTATTIDCLQSLLLIAQIFYTESER